MSEVMTIRTRDKKDLIHISGADSDGQVWLTPDEALDMALQLLHAIQQIKKEKRSRKKTT